MGFTLSEEVEKSKTGKIDRRGKREVGVQKIT